MTQQKQTLDYFRKSADDWQRKALNEHGAFDLIANRNAAVLATIATMPNARSMLDVGCGTGQLVIDSARLGLSSHGIDFAPEMIKQCEANREAAKVAARFDCVSAFDLAAEPGTYDVVSAQGFIEYITPDETMQFLTQTRRMLKPGGAIVLGSRNRLYNLTSLNDFTILERSLGTLDMLASEAVTLQTSATQAEAIAILAKLMRNLPQPAAHPDTGIGVSLRHQYTPAELIDRLHRSGFETRTIYPVHFHGLPLAIKAEHPDMHNALATAMQALAQTDHRAVPYCSSFVIDARAAA